MSKFIFLLNLDRLECLSLGVLLSYCLISNSKIRNDNEGKSKKGDKRVDVYNYIPRQQYYGLAWAEISKYCYSYQ
jgi:hypothetical protein